MFGDSRVVTTAFLRRLNGISRCDDLQIGAAAVRLLCEDGLHLLVPVAHTHGMTEKIVCRVQMMTASGRPLTKEALVSGELLEGLPTAFSALAASRDLVPATVEHLDEELRALIPVGDDPADPVAGDPAGELRDAAGEQRD
jgi:hypothetical protein